MTGTARRWIVAGGASVLLLAGCTANQPAPTTSGAAAAADGVLTVSSTADACTVSAATAKSGNTTFKVTNDGDKTTEFYLLGDDGLRIVAERENIAPGSSADLSVALQPGSYFTACKPGMRGEGVGKAAFTVTGQNSPVDGATQAVLGQVVADYLTFVKEEVAELQPQVAKLATAYADGDDTAARQLFATTRVHYERIEPIAEALGILDPRIDYREIDYKAEASALAKDDPTFTQWLGFHRIEKDLWVPAKSALQPDGSSAWDGWQPSTSAQRKVIASTLVADVARLSDTVQANDFASSHGLSVATISNGAANLLEEIATSKVTGEEDWWSHTDLYDFQGNLDGARVAFTLVAPLAQHSGAGGEKLVATITAEFDKLQKLLDKHGSATAGFASYDTISRAERRVLVEQIDATREPLSKLTNSVLGVGGGQ